MGNIGKWVLAAVQGALSAGAVAAVGGLIHQFTGADFSQFTSDPSVLAAIAAAVGAIIRGLNWVMGKLD